MEASSDCKTSVTYLTGTDQPCCVESIILSASAKFLHFTFEDETPARQNLGRKQIEIKNREKMIYIDIGYNSAHHQTDK